MANYLKLGPKADSFNAPQDNLHLVKGMVVIEPKKKSFKLKSAIQGGHVISAGEDEFNAYQESLPEEQRVKAEPKKSVDKKTKEETLEDKLKKMDNEKLAKFYDKTYELTQAQKNAFDELTKDEKIAFLLDLESEE